MSDPADTVGGVHRVFVDSNVLGSKTQYDWLFLLRQRSSMFALVTSDDVLDEAHRVWRRKHQTAGGEMRKRHDRLFRENFDEVLDEWDGGEASALRDLDDTHVHNAACHARVDIVLTNNVADFGDPNALPYDLYAPDEFFELVSENSRQGVQAVVLEQARYWAGRLKQDGKKRSLSEALINAGCPRFASSVEQHLRLLTGERSAAALDIDNGVIEIR